MAILTLALGCAAASAAPRRALTGSFGGPHVVLELDEHGGRIEYDCAHGTIDEPVVPDRDGAFEAPGTHVAEHPGPVREGEEAGRAARYRGRISGARLLLTVTLVGSGEEIGAFTLTRDASSRLTKCL